MTDKSRLRIALEKFLTDFNFGALLSNAVKVLEENKEIEFISLLDKMFDIIIEASRGIPELHDIYLSAKQGKHQAGLSLMSGLAQQIGGGAISAVSSPIFGLLNQELNKKFKASLLDAGAYVAANRLGLMSPDVFADRIARLGLSDHELLLLSGISQHRLDYPQLLQIAHRFPDEVGSAEERAVKLGWAPYDLNLVRLAQYQYPSIQDWILFGVRESLDDTKAAFFGLDSDTPPMLETEAVKSGLAPGYSKYYWRAHWQLPPLTLGYEFLHRFRHDDTELKFTDADLAKLIQALDYAPIWHKRMMAASYNPITRVDIRRVLKAGKLTEDGVLNAYYKDGYSDEDAKLLTDWTLWEAQSSMRDLSLARVEEAVDKGIMTELEAQTALEDLRIDPEDITRYLKLWAYDREKKRVDAEVDYLSAQYMNNEIDEQNLRSQLTQLGLTANNVYIAVTNLNAKRKRQVTPLTTAEIYQMYAEAIITKDEALTELLARGVNKVNADRQMKLIMLKKQRETDKALQDAQEQLDKEQAKTIINEKAVALAKLAVSSSTLQAEAVDLKIASADITDEATLASIDQRQLEIKHDLAYLALEKSKTNLTFAEEIRTNASK